MKTRLQYLFFNTLRKIGVGFNPLKSPEVQSMAQNIKKSGGKLIFHLKYEENGDWIATAKDFPGMITGGNFYKDSNIAEQLVDAAFTYFGVPAKYCDNSLFLQTKKSSHFHQPTFKLSFR